MGEQSSIEWTDATWQPITGCSVVSPGCTNCYAMRLAGTRLQHHPSRAGLTRDTKAGPVWTGEVRLNEAWLTQPLHWRRPRRIFVCAHGDLFAEGVPDEWVDRVFAVMALAPQHTFQVLTKRSARMLEWSRRNSTGGHIFHVASKMGDPRSGRWPLRNVWLGVSAEDQRRADERVPDLLASPAAVRFVSAEPMLGPIDFTTIDDGPRDGTHLIFDALTGHAHDGEQTITGVFGNPDHHLDWIIVGGESGSGARYNWVPNVRSIVQQCQAAGVPVFVKQLGADVRDRNDAGFEGCEPHEWPDVDPASVEHDLNGTRDGYQGAPVRIHLRSRKGGDPSEWPLDLRVREMPEAARDA